MTTNNDATRALTKMPEIGTVNKTNVYEWFILHGETIRTALLKSAESHEAFELTKRLWIKQTDENIQLKAQVDGLVTALEWYAGDGKNRDFKIVDDKGSYLATLPMLGDRAKEALKAIRAAKGAS